MRFLRRDIERYLMIFFKYLNHSITTTEKKCRKYRGKWLGRRKEGKNKLDSASFPKNRFDNCETLILVAHAWMVQHMVVVPLFAY